MQVRVACIYGQYRPNTEKVMAVTVKVRATQYARGRVIRAAQKTGETLTPAEVNERAKVTPSLLALARVNLARERSGKARPYKPLRILPGLGLSNMERRA